MAPQKGDVVTFVSPNNRSRLFIKRIEALPGDRVRMPDGSAQTVPNGFAFLLGENRGDSLDSRQFGFVPLRDIVAKARQVYCELSARMR